MLLLCCCCCRLYVCVCVRLCIRANLRSLTATGNIPKITLLVHHLHFVRACVCAVYRDFRIEDTFVANLFVAWVFSLLYFGLCFFFVVRCDFSLVLWWHLVRLSRERYTRAEANSTAIDSEEAEWKGRGGGRRGSESRLGTARTTDSDMATANTGKVKFDVPSVPVIFVLGNNT